ncbi:hypothetical protein E2C01_098523 [Portunus trituberculatus]|uniref:Uncharacterized protein n=1 Tax=Portunus trituberculatus TaxID=210409 RepID=A0A5B7K8H1_PORTR|nr:hypothetical protein [Portunus trituberculatus]
MTQKEEEEGVEGVYKLDNRMKSGQSASGRWAGRLNITDEERTSKMGEEPAKGNKPAVEPKADSSAFTKKIIKLMTVAAYMSGVSGAGVLLSLYYILFWDPRITGVRPPGYLKSGARLGLPEAQAQVMPIPEAYNGKNPIPFPHKMSRQFMEAYLSNYTEGGCVVS